MVVVKLKKPLSRRIGNLIIRIEADGLSLRGHHKHVWHPVSWNRVMSLLEFSGNGEAVLLVRAEEEAGKRVLKKLTAPTKPQGK
jgi:hypothetical protein